MSLLKVLSAGSDEGTNAPALLTKISSAAIRQHAIRQDAFAKMLGWSRTQRRRVLEDQRRPGAWKMQRLVVAAALTLAIARGCTSFQTSCARAGIIHSRPSSFRLAVRSRPLALRGGEQNTEDYGVRDTAEKGAAQGNSFDVLFLGSGVSVGHPHAHSSPICRARSHQVCAVHSNQDGHACGDLIDPGLQTGVPKIGCIVRPDNKRPHCPGDDTSIQ